MSSDVLELYGKEYDRRNSEASISIIYSLSWTWPITCLKFRNSSLLLLDTIFSRSLDNSRKKWLYSLPIYKIVYIAHPTFLLNKLRVEKAQHTSLWYWNIPLSLFFLNQVNLPITHYLTSQIDPQSPLRHGFIQLLCSRRRCSTRQHLGFRSLQPIYCHYYKS